MEGTVVTMKLTFHKKTVKRLLLYQHKQQCFIHQFTCDMNAVRFGTEHGCDSRQPELMIIQWSQ
jgi:fructose/tagatose bisphosphate aldolase